MEQINNVCKAVRDSKGTPQESTQMSRLQKLKNKFKQRKSAKGRQLKKEVKSARKAASASKGLAIRFQNFYEKYKG